MRNEIAARGSTAEPRAHKIGSAARSALAAAGLAALVVACGGEGSELGGAGVAGAASAIRAAFPDEAAAVLDGAAGLARVGGGFSGEGLRGLAVTLRSHAADGVAFRSGGFAFALRENDLDGEAAAVGASVVYAGRRHAAFWRATEAGYEEWLHLGRGVAFADRAATSWDVDGAALRQVGDAVELVDEAGAARVRVTAPAAFAKGGRPVPVRLEVAGARIAVVVDADGDEVLVDPLWTPAASMTYVHENHTATLLGNGSVLVVAGLGQTQTELYDPTADAWSSAGTIRNRAAFATTVLQSGKVLVVGGYDNTTGDIADVQIYDPATNLWTAGASMPTVRQSHTATTLADGRVLVAGGRVSTTVYLKTAVIYDPATNKWTAAAPMNFLRFQHSATLMPDGTVLVVGGGYAGAGMEYLDTNEVYDPVADTWTVAPSLNVPRRSHTATVLANGKLLVAGGTAALYCLNSAEVYDPATTTWTLTAPMNFARCQHAATLTPNGQVLVTGGNGFPSATEVYDPTSNAWSFAPDLVTPRFWHSATLLPDGDVLVAGGIDMTQTGISSAELLPTFGNPCTVASDCPHGFCIDDVCCSTECGAAPCQACAVAKGADVNGICKLISGAQCDDSDACTSNDACVVGVCVGGPAVVCQPKDECHDAGICRPTTGCADPALPDGTPCSAGVCMDGVCTPESGTGGASATSTSSSSSSTGGGAGGGGGQGGGGGSASSSTSASSGSTAVTSATATSGAGGSSPGDSSAGDTGCGCRAAGERTDGALPLACAALALLVESRRRARPGPHAKRRERSRRNVRIG